MEAVSEVFLMENAQSFFGRPRNSFAFHNLSALTWFVRPQGTTMTNAQQFEMFMRNYQNMVFSTAMRLLANHAEAEDVTQEVFLKAFERFDQLRDSPTAGGWLKTVATNLCLNHLSRYRSRWSFFSELFRGDNESENEVEFTVEPSDSGRDQERHEEIDLALRTLPPAQRVPLVLYHLDELTYEEIAQKLGVSLGKVKTDIFRGREALRKKLRIHLE
jgi:RNA polymerase sigma-70 factor (ECF subfamily)